MSPTTTTTSPDELRLRLGGGLHEPGDPAYEDACVLFNSMIERRPALVARCIAPDDVIASLAFARESEMDVAVRAGGHSVAGLSLSDGGLVLDVRGMDEIEVDPVRRIARVGGGATWAAVDRATGEHGLATTGGRVSTTGVAGLTLGGGSGWLERKHGLASDNLLSVELVTADGSIVRASEDENADLFWALNGGGGNFGVVTSLEFRLHPVGPEVYGGLIIHPVERGAELMRVWRDVMRDAPEELSLGFLYLVAPDEPDIPAELRGRQVCMVGGMHTGSLEEGEKAMESIRSFAEPAVDMMGPIPYPELQCILDDPPGYRNYWTAEHLRDLPDETIDALHSRYLEMPEGILGQLLMVAWGGEVSRVGEERSPLAGRTAPFIVHPLVLWDEARDDEAATAWGRSFRDVVSDVALGSTYANFTGDEGAARARSAYGERSYERLARVKAQWDPEDRFRASGHVPPA